MDLKDLTLEQKIEITLETLKNQPTQTIGHMALLKMAELGISTCAEETELKTEATFNDERYKCKMTVTWERT